MMEENIKPSIIKSFYEMTQDLMFLGFKQRDIILLIRDRMKNKIGLVLIKDMLQAIIKFENDFAEFQNIIGEKNRKELEAKE